ncbi:hypothetical protein V1477_020320 [Vespula maculifrons]|uniref:Uncharacterized protein n=1 Tax=Vespula maculifrons TaxID=7453 RepID=A0ABD2ALT5_VESMC
MVPDAVTQPSADLSMFSKPTILQIPLNVSHGNRENMLFVFLRKMHVKERVRRLSVDIKMHDCKFSFISWRNTPEAGGVPNWKAQLQSSPGRRLGSPSVLLPILRIVRNTNSAVSELGYFYDLISGRCKTLKVRENGNLIRFYRNDRSTACMQNRKSLEKCILPQQRTTN